MARIAERVAYAAGYLAGLVLLAIIALTMVEVVSRYVLNNPLILSDEFGGYAMVAISFLGMAYCAMERSHIRITFIVEALSARRAGAIRLFTLALGVLFVAVSAWVSWQFLADSFTRDMRSNSLLMLPLKWPQMAIPIGFTLFAVVFAGLLAKAIRDFRAGRAADHFGAEEF
jgi:TRAP-type C4-dicarboxylate transport system permease small subunit